MHTQFFWHRTVAQSICGFKGTDVYYEKQIIEDVTSLLERVFQEIVVHEPVKCENRSLGEPESEFILNKELCLVKTDCTDNSSRFLFDSNCKQA